MNRPQKTPTVLQNVGMALLVVLGSLLALGSLVAQFRSH